VKFASEKKSFNLCEKALEDDYSKKVINASPLKLQVDLRSLQKNSRRREKTTVQKKL